MERHATPGDSTLSELKERLRDRVASVRAEQKRIIKEHGDLKISEVTVAQAYGGMRGVTCMVTETSAVDSHEGIRFRGYNIAELRQALPKTPDGTEPLAEGVFFLLLTGEIPGEDDVRRIHDFWRQNETLPDTVIGTLDQMPVDTHPMTQFSVGILAMQRESRFARRFGEGMPRSEYWEATLDDSMLLLARLPLLAAYIYRRSYRQGRQIRPAEKTLDWAANLAHMIGARQETFRELMRLYLTIHADHEGGNVSAHTTHLVGSALSDPYLCLSAGMNGLAGPRHGSANQEVMRWIAELKRKLGGVPTREQLDQYVRDTLRQGRVVPGYGHAVLRRTDPRYTALREFALEHLPEDENFKIVQMLYQVVPGILEEQGKARSPWPSVDAQSGCLLVHYGITEYDFFTVLFGVSRALGVLASLVWDRAVLLPLERPKSVTTDWIRQRIAEDNRKP